MYILNPSQDQLNSWFKCKGGLAKYLLEKVPVIHAKDGFYYFVKSNSWENAMKEIPTWIKVRELLKF